eukprot:TRINITY_DN286_c0_g1_i1.p1 TRINITY_DN286_c0_g1~~TRINITY_DN286_c0_g1_i1.p1  ORF type:complete len:1043 (+),score=222.68 TRINITY_DN286_c0_g1_i1:29421-32549(+)
MIEGVIRWSVTNRILVLLVTIILVICGVFAVKQTPIDAIPDLSDVQVIVKTSYAGQSPQVVEDQITYPLTTALMSVPGAKTVRGFSFFGDSYVYVIFDDNTDIYWARSRVAENMSQLAGLLPQGVTPELGPDATGVGWVFMYALVDNTNTRDAGQLRALQDWFLKYELQSVQGVSEVATVGGMAKQYLLQIQPQKLQAYNVPLSHIESALTRANSAIGASVIEMAEAEYMVTSTAYLSSIQDIQNVPLGKSDDGVALTIGHIASVVEAPLMRRGIAELNGNGEVVGGIIVMRFKENAKDTIDRVKAKLKALEQSLPDGVEIVTVYDRSTLIDSAVNTLWSKLFEELVVVGAVCLLFLFHLRSSLVAIVSLPIGILVAFIIMKLQGLNANIMSLGGIAIAIGAMVDGAIVLVENLHKHIEKARAQGKPIDGEARWNLVITSASEVGPALFFSLLIITVSFIPVFTLEAQEGRMFAPLAFTKTYAMAVAAALAVTLVPVLAGYFVRGHIRGERENPLNRGLVKGYKVALSIALNHPKKILIIAFLSLVSTLWPLKHIGVEFMPALDEGSLLYMPTTYPGISIGKARELLQQTDKLIATVPEVQQVFGKVGRADTATDPAPLTMIETFIQLKPKAQWRAGMTTEKLKETLNALIQFPGVSNAWVMPIKTRIDMLATGIKTPVGIKIAGPDLDGIQAIGMHIERALDGFENTVSVFAEKVASGRYITIDINRTVAAKYGLNVMDIQGVIDTAVGGRAIGKTVEGRERFPISLRYPQFYRDSPDALRSLPIVLENGANITLGEVTTIAIKDGPAGIKSENARLNGWVFIDIENGDLGSYVSSAKQHISNTVALPEGYSLTWSGQFEYLARAKVQLAVVVPLTLMTILLLLYLTFGRLIDVMLIMTTLPFALIGGYWLLYVLGFNFSVAVAVGFIALAGVAVETGVIMLVYLHQSMDVPDSQVRITKQALKYAIIEGATRRVRPVIMTSLCIILGLLPVLYATGTGAEIMQRIAAPMVGGMLSALLLTLFVLPTAFYFVQLQRQKLVV